MTQSNLTDLSYNCGKLFQAHFVIQPARWILLIVSPFIFTTQSTVQISWNQQWLVADLQLSVLLETNQAFVLTKFCRTRKNHAKLVEQLFKNFVKDSRYW